MGKLKTNKWKWILAAGTLSAIASPIAMVIACSKEATPDVTDPDVTPPDVTDPDETISDELKAAYESIEGKSLLTDVSRNGNFEYNHKDVITRLYDYKDFYEENYEIEDLVVGYAGEYENWIDKIDATSNIVFGSQGGPTKGTSGTYFDQIFDSLDETGNTADGGFDTSIDLDGTDLKIGVDWYDGTNDEDWHLISVKQAQVVHNLDEDVVARYKNTFGSDTGFNTEYAFDMNLKTIAIFEVVANHFHDDLGVNTMNWVNHSFGAMMAPLWLSTFGWIHHEQTGEHKFDNVAIGAGRLLFNEETIKMTSKGFMSDFDEPVQDPVTGEWTQRFDYHEDDLTQDPDMITYVNGILAEEDQDEYYHQDPIWQPGDTSETIFNKLRANFLLQNGFGALDFIAMMDEYSGAYGNVTYAHGGMDRATGMLHPEEREAIQRHFKTELFTQEDEHNIPTAFALNKPDNVWNIFGIKNLRIMP